MPTEHEVVLPDWDSLVTARDRLKEEGWECLPNDRPELGIRGFAAYREGEKAVWLKWLVYGRELSPKVRVCADWQEFLAELEFRRDEDMEKADSLEEGHVGFATYGRAATSGIAEITRIPVLVLQEGGPVARQQLVKLLMSSKHPRVLGLKAVIGGLSRG